MYTGEYKLSNIRSFIDGYTFSIIEEKRRDEFFSDFSGFHDWIATKYGFYESTAGWQNMILAIEMGLTPKKVQWESISYVATEKDHIASVAKFFELVEEYKNA